MRIKIALDCVISHNTIAELTRHFDIVRIALEKEPDEIWVHEAINNGAFVIVSKDNDVKNIVSKYEDSSGDTIEVAMPVRFFKGAAQSLQVKNLIDLAVNRLRRRIKLKEIGE